MEVKTSHRFQWWMITIVFVLSSQQVSASHLLTQPNSTRTAKLNFLITQLTTDSIQQTQPFTIPSFPYFFFSLSDLIKTVEQTEKPQTTEKTTASKKDTSLLKADKRWTLTTVSNKKQDTILEKSKTKQLKVVDGKPYLAKQEITWEQYHTILGTSNRDWEKMNTNTKQLSDKVTPYGQNIVAGSGVNKQTTTIAIKDNKKETSTVEKPVENKKQEIEKTSDQTIAKEKAIKAVKEDIIAVVAKENTTKTTKEDIIAVVAKENVTEKTTVITSEKTVNTLSPSYKEELRKERAQHLAQETAMDAPQKPMVEVMIVDGQYYVNGVKASYMEFQEACKMPSSSATMVPTQKVKQTNVLLNSVQPSTIPVLLAAPKSETAEATEIATRGVYVNYLDARNMPDTLLLSNIYNESIPSHQHYDFQWDNRRVHPYKHDLTQMPRVVTFLLTHGFEEDFSMPTIGYITSEFGPRWKRYHNGIDIDLETGDPVKAAFKGKVRIAQTSSGYGYLVVLRHYNGLETYYAHLSKILVEEGQDVEPGEVIALGGSTGRSTGSHLHFEVRYKGHPLNAREFIDFRRNRLKHHVYHLDRSYFTSSSPYKSSHDLEGNVERIAVKTKYTPKSKSAAKAKSARSKGRKSKSGNSYHRIRRGDTLEKIARRYRTSINRLCKLNRMSKRTILRVGRKLKVR